MTGYQLLHYTVLEEIGQGGMSIVHRARDMRLERDVAIKLLHPVFAQKLEYRARLAREARAAAKLQHPNIVQVYDYSGENEDGNGKKNDQPLFIVTELVTGQNLRDFAELHQLHKYPELCAIMIGELALALQHAHVHGVIHRDIKPENIMVNHEGVLKLMDFGIAQMRNQESLTVTGALLGSPAHMAPEMIEGKEIGPAADVFSLATVMYWLCTGALPFSANTPHALLRAITEGRFVPPQQRSPRISDAIAAVITRGMALAPKDRFARAQDMAQAIEQALIDAGITADFTRVHRILEHPDQELPKFGHDVRQRYIARTKTYTDANEPAKAMAIAALLLADDPDSSEFQSAFCAPKARSNFFRRFSLYALAICLALVGFGYWQWHHVPALVPVVLRQTPIPVLQAPAPPPVLVAKKGIHVHVAPFADILLDDKPIAQNASDIEIEAVPGQHKLTFLHQYAVTQERSFVVNARGEPPSISVELIQTKPSKLIIRSNEDADIFVDGRFRGTAKESETVPIVFALPPKTHAVTKEIVISRKGYKPLLISQEFVAGETHTLPIELSK